MDNLLMEEWEYTKLLWDKNGSPTWEDIAKVQRSKILQEFKALVGNIHPTGDIYGALEKLIERMEKE